MSFLRLRHISKRFPGVVALDDVGFAVEKGACHALLGENGAGKSSLGKIIAGVEMADEGEIELDGRKIVPATPLAARQLGIAMVHQELAFCPNLSVAENLCLGDLPRRFGWVDRTTMRDQAKALLAEIDSQIPVDEPIGQLSTGQEQIVQIAGALAARAKVIVMDEPTSSLSLRESEQLFHLLARLKQRAITVIYISHRMPEIFQLCDAVTVLRDGRHIATQTIAETSPGRVIQQMIGRDLALWEPRHLARELGDEVLRVENLESPGKFEPISFSLRAGEVLGVGGLIGAGRSEMAQAIFGLDPEARGTIIARGTALEPGRVSEALRAGIGFLPEDRKRLGLVLSLNCRENVSLASLPELTRLGFVNRGKESAWAREYIERLQIKAPSPETAVNTLSGGNQQKIALAKWLSRQCAILIVDEPTRGIDVGAKAQIHELLDELAQEGLALLVISSELPELMSISRRILVMREGRLAGELERKDFSQERLMTLMAGVGE